jgi:hypothetical protein
VTGAPGRGTGAGACPRGHCRLAACPGDRILRIRSRILGLIYSLRAIYSHTARPAQLRDLGLRLEIKSRSGHLSLPPAPPALLLDEQ